LRILTEKTEEEDEDEDSENEENQVHPLYIVKLIDFARSKYTPGEGPDENSLTGIRNLIDIYQKLEHIYSE
jgi:1D-myo-inositol-tetrakisphosphate 5-kinase/inositol-polyphosphate multikinase